MIKILIFTIVWSIQLKKITKGKYYDLKDSELMKIWKMYWDHDIKI